MQLLLQYFAPQCPAISASQISISSTQLHSVQTPFPELQFEKYSQAEDQDEYGAHLLCFPPLKDKLCSAFVQLLKTLAPKFCSGLYFLMSICTLHPDVKPFFCDTMTEAQIDFITHQSWLYIQGYFIVIENSLENTGDNSGLFK